MGVVSKGFDPTIRRTVALKTIAFSEQDEEAQEFRRRLYGEAAAAGALKHPNIVTIYDVIEDGPTTAIAMEFIEGYTLASVIRKRGPLAVDEALALFEPICAALDHAGSRGIIHRDIKPANIIVDPDGSPKITDFGIAKMPASSTRTGIIVGSPGYMSPEQIRGQPLDRRSDLFSAAAVFYEMITADRPFDGDDTASLMYRIVHERHRSAKQLNPALGQAVAEILDRALAKNPDERFGTGAELVAALRAAFARPAAPAVVKPAQDWDAITAMAPAPTHTESAVNRVLEAELRRRPARVWLLAGAAGLVAVAIVAAIVMRGPARTTLDPTPAVEAPVASVPSSAAPLSPIAVQETQRDPVPAARSVPAVRSDSTTSPSASSASAGVAAPGRPAGGLDVTYAGQAYPVVLYAGNRRLGSLERGGLLRVDPGDQRIRVVAESVFLKQDFGNLALRAGERKPLLLPAVASVVIGVRGDAYAGVRIEVDDRAIAGPYPAQIPQIAEGGHVVRFLWVAGPLAGKELKRPFDARAPGHFLIRALPEDAEISIQRVR